MDPIGLAVLLREIQADSAVITDAATKAGLRLRETVPGHLESCAYELHRCYNVFEKVLERVCEAFENHLEPRGDYHERLLQRLSLDLPGVRPALIPADRLTPLRELKGFRHVVRHAYDLALRPDRMTDFVQYAAELAAELPQWMDRFARRVTEEQGW